MDIDDQGNKRLDSTELHITRIRPEFAQVISWLASWGVTPKDTDSDEMTVVRAMCDIRRVYNQLEEMDPIWYNDDAFGRRVRNDLDRTRDSLRNALAETVYLRELHEQD